MKNKKKPLAEEQEDKEQSTGEPVPEPNSDTAQETSPETPSAESLLKEAEDKYMRLQAEFQNYKKRVEKEKADFMKFANETLMHDLIPLMDNMERAQTAMADSPDEKIREGVGMVKRSLDELFQKYDLVKIPALGADFDHDLHHAVLTEEGADAPDKVVQVLQEGYTLKGKVIRPSMVKVSK
ncbi:MAG: nucleotide exchange factor GrpE [Bacillota bacterium]|nr:nucleotide exchange factor GrpE [Bacillota bacterium]